MSSKILRTLTPLLAALALAAPLAAPASTSTPVSPPGTNRPVAAAPEDVAAVPVAYAGTVYLTFDDGPNYTWTPRILAVLRKYGVHAVFFEVGENITWYPSITRSLRYYGNLIGNHTWNHPNLTTLSDYWVNWQLNRMEWALGYRPRCVRPPYGATSYRIQTIIANRGQRHILWTVDPSDWARPGTWTIVNRVLYYVRGGSRILLHDGGGGRSQTVAALDLLIPRLWARGFVIGLMAC